jgi:hypothetical protein
MSRGESNRELVVVPATDDGSLVGVFPYPDYVFGVNKDFHAVYVFKHYKIHVASLLIIQNRPFSWANHRAVRSIVSDVEIPMSASGRGRKVDITCPRHPASARCFRGANHPTPRADASTNRVGQIDYERKPERRFRLSAEHTRSLRSGRRCAQPRFRYCSACLPPTSSVARRRPGD